MLQFHHVGDYMASGAKRDKSALSKVLQTKLDYLRKLIIDCEKLDLGDDIREETAVDMSGIMRNLLLDRGRQTSLLSQLELKNELFFDNKVDPLSGPNNLITESHLLSILSSSDGLFYKSIHEQKSGPKLDFMSWWNEIVIDNKEEKNNLITRKEIVCILADKEDAHTDPEFEFKYDVICNNNGMKWYSDGDGVVRYPNNNPYKESVISIAKELLDAFEFRKQLLLYPIRSKNTSVLRFYVTRNVVNKSDNYVDYGYRFKLWPGGESDSIFWAILGFDFTAQTERLLGNCSTMWLKSPSQPRAKNFTFMSSSQANIQLHYIFSAEHQVFCLITNEMGRITLISGSKIRKTDYFQADSLRVVNEFYYTRNDNVFDSIESLREACGIPPTVEYI